MSSSGEEDDIFGDFVNSASKKSVNHGDVHKEKFSVTKAVTVKNKALPGSDTGLGGGNKTVTGSNETVTFQWEYNNQRVIIDVPKSSKPGLTSVYVLDEQPGSSLPSGGIKGQLNPINIVGGIEGQSSTSEIRCGTYSTKGQPGPSHEPNLSVKLSSYHKRKRKYDDYYSPPKPGENPEKKEAARKLYEYREKKRRQEQGINSGKDNAPSLPGDQQESIEKKGNEILEDLAQLREEREKYLAQLREEREKYLAQLREEREKYLAQLREEREKYLAQLREEREKYLAQLREEREKKVKEFLEDNHQEQPNYCRRCNEQDEIVKHFFN